MDRVTCNGHHLTMKTKTVGIAELKARLSAHLKSVQKGHPITVMDRGRAVAQIVPVAAERKLSVRKATRAPHSVRIPPPPAYPTDSLAALLEERQGDR